MIAGRASGRRRSPVWRLGIIPVLAAVLVVASCSEGSTTTVVDPEASSVVGPSFLLQVSALQTDCCFDEGSTGLLEILDSDGVRVGPLHVSSAPFGAATTDSSTAYRTIFSPIPLNNGSYSVNVWQELCAAGCADDQDAIEFAESGINRQDECSTTVTVDGGDIAVEAVWAPANGCASFEPRASS